jgi:RNA ligase (TIGR02306 family)
VVSTHSVNIIEISEVHRHENADRLEIIPVGGWQAVVKAGQFKAGDRAVYIEPDYTVPTARPEFAFLAKEGRERHRLKAVRLRGALSFGLLIPVPDELADLNVGDNVMERLGIERYEPPVKLAGSDELPENEWPQAYAPKFDVEPLNKFPAIFQEGEVVVVTEKIHGANARYLWSNGAFYIGSRTRWLKPDVEHAWKKAADGEPRIKTWCREHLDTVLYGEIYGPVQSLKYGSPNAVKFAAFAANHKGAWIDTVALHEYDIPLVPRFYIGPWDPGAILPFAEHDSLVRGAEAGHICEGIVIVPQIERRDVELGRVALKHISTRYWESAA